MKAGDKIRYLLITYTTNRNYKNNTKKVEQYFHGTVLEYGPKMSLVRLTNDRGVTKELKVKTDKLFLEAQNG